MLSDCSNFFCFFLLHFITFGALAAKCELLAGTPLSFSSDTSLPKYVIGMDLNSAGENEPLTIYYVML